ncbi:MAG: RICIN domain-containing protein, partial [Ruminococcus sp.]|nr:RICIN domain-containing protein [Ruminococcus sp.]
TGADNQLFKIVQDGAFYGIVSKVSGDTAGLDVYGWSEQNGGIINQWNYWGGACLMWKLTPVRPEIADGKYTIKNLNSGLFISSDNDNVIQGNTENWTISAQNDGTYTIQAQNGKALTVENGSDSDGADISLENLSGDSSQKFNLYVNDDGTYTILSAVSDSKSCADVYGISLENGANICQWNYWGGDGQKFIIEPASLETVIGDVNADGKFSVADVVMLQKWIINAGDITDLGAGDLNKDDRVDSFDLVLMKQEIVKQK